MNTFKKLLCNLFFTRINRRNFWLGLFIATSVNLILLYIKYLMYGSIEGNDEGEFHYAQVFINIFFHTVLGLSLYIRRFHDISKSGYYSLLLLIPLINIFYLIQLLALKGISEKNKYGSIPDEKLSISTIFGIENN